MTKLIYASGHIAATDYDAATSWYARADALLNPTHKLTSCGRGYVETKDRPFELIRPMRGKDFLSRVVGPLGTGGNYAVNDTALQAEMVTSRGITARDRNDVMRCDAVLMNLTGAPSKISIGCAIEAGWADAARKPIVIVRQKDNVMAGHPILEGVAAYTVETLEEGCTLVRLLLGA